MVGFVLSELGLEQSPEAANQVEEAYCELEELGLVVSPENIGRSPVCQGDVPRRLRALTAEGVAAREELLQKENEASGVQHAGPRD